MAQTATTGNLENAQKIIIATARYTEEHNAPPMNLIEQINLPSGNKQVTVPKVGQMSMSDLQDGIDIVDEEDSGMTTIDLTASEVGAKISITDKLSRQSAQNVFSIIGRQLGDGIFHLPCSRRLVRGLAGELLQRSSPAQRRSDLRGWEHHHRLR